jgi:hypothetical protein
LDGIALVCQISFCQKGPKQEFLPNLKSKLELNLDPWQKLHKLKQFGRPHRLFFRIFDKMKIDKLKLCGLGLGNKA